MIDKIFSALEDPSCVVSLMSVDFSKAFNRVDHRACLDALARGGASTDSLRMVASFLRERRMRFKVNNVLLEERHVRGGSPQGTRLEISYSLSPLTKLRTPRLTTSPRKWLGPLARQTIQLLNKTSLA